MNRKSRAVERERIAQTSVQPRIYAVAIAMPLLTEILLATDYSQGAISMRRTRAIEFHIRTIRKAPCLA